LGIGTPTYTEALFAASAAAYGALLVLLLVSGRANRTRTLLVAACAATGGSAVAVAAGWTTVLGPSGAIAELASTGGWCAFAFHLLHKQRLNDTRGLRLVGACGIAIGISILGFAFLSPHPLRGETISLAVSGEFLSRIGLGVYGVLLTENLYRNTAPESRWHIHLLCIALAGLFAHDIVLYADTFLFRRLSLLLWNGRAIALIIAAPLFAVSAARNRNWAIDIHVSRAVVFHTATLIGSGIFLLGLALTGEVVRAAGPGWGDVAEVTLVMAGFVAIGVLLTSGAARSRLRRFLAENFFSHRYDYRQEWLKSIEILSANPSRAAVQTRVINAVAGIADSPAGVLWVRDVEGAAFHWAGSWNHPAIAAAEPADSPFMALFRGGSWVVELERSQIRPEWLADIASAWLAVPLAQQDQLIGFVVLVRARAPFKLDRETFDVLRIVGRQAATHVAEQRYAQALAEGRELHDYGKRFAFLVHDMKNVAGQLSMIVQNAGKHEGDPEFHHDVLNTVRAALDRMNDLLKKLRPGQAALNNGLMIPIDIINETVVAIRRSRGVNIDVEHDRHTAAVAMDAGIFRSVILHLCENAIETSGEVKVRVHHGPMRLQIEVVDSGEGMTPEFIRDTLFQPFGSTKGNGFGIGAYQARELVRAAGGDLFALSRPGSGTTMRILLPCIDPRQSGASVAPDLEAAG
jgi:putative PEP-CTERM system histidine kinase